MGNDDQASLFPDHTHTETLAAKFGLPVAQFVEVFGAGWAPLPDTGANLDADPSGSGYIFGQWFITGDPAQLMLRVRTDEDMAELAVPRGILVGHGEVVYQPQEPHRMRLGPHLIEAAPPLVNDLLKRRRSTFRYCRYCRALTPPEGRNASDTCYGCATDWRGVIY